MRDQIIEAIEQSPAGLKVGENSEGDDIAAGGPAQPLETGVEARGEILLTWSEDQSTSGRNAAGIHLSRNWRATSGRDIAWRKKRSWDCGRFSSDMLDGVSAS